MQRCNEAIGLLPARRLSGFVLHGDAQPFGSSPSPRGWVCVQRCGRFCLAIRVVKPAAWLINEWHPLPSERSPRASLTRIYAQAMATSFACTMGTTVFLNADRRATVGALAILAPALA